MSLVGTLAKVALGVAAVKGAGYVASQRGGGKGSSVSNGSLPGPDTTRASAAGAQPGIGDLLTSVLGGKGQAGGGTSVACSNNSLLLQVLGPLPARRHRLPAAVSTR